jgi:amidohydrolase
MYTPLLLTAAAKEIIYYGDQKRVCDCCNVKTLGGTGQKIGISKAWLMSQNTVSSSSLSEDISMGKDFQKPIKYMNLKRNEVANNLRNIAMNTIDQNQIDIDMLSKQIHEHPELNYEEHYAHEVITNFLKERGFKVKAKWGGIETAFVAECGTGEKPIVAICCEYDALPDIGHACGHNLIASSAMAAALGLQAALNQSSVGTVRILGTPAEEGGGGKIELINRGALKDVDCAMMVHPAPADILYPAMPSIERVIFEWFGKNAHAASAPYQGVNALDAVIQCFNNIGLARQQFRESWRVHGIIAEGGVKPNIIPNYTKAVFYVRAPTMPETEELKQKVIACGKGAGIATGCKFKYSSPPNAQGIVEKPYRELNTNIVLAEIYRENARDHGITYYPKSVEQANSCGSTDMGNVSFEVPSIHPMFRIPCRRGEGNHTAGFTEFCGKKGAFEKARTCGKIMAMTTLDLFLKPELIDEAKKLFNNPVKNRPQRI